LHTQTQQLAVPGDTTVVDLAQMNTHHYKT